MEKRLWSFVKPLSTSQTSSVPGWAFPSTQMDPYIITKSQPQKAKVAMKQSTLYSSWNPSPQKSIYRRGALSVYQISLCGKTESASTKPRVLGIY